MNMKPFAITATFWHGSKHSKKSLVEKLSDMRNCSGGTGMLVWAKNAKKAALSYRQTWEAHKTSVSHTSTSILTCRATPITMENAWHLLDEGLNPFMMENGLPAQHPRKRLIMKKFNKMLKMRDEIKVLFMKG